MATTQLALCTLELVFYITTLPIVCFITVPLLAVKTKYGMHDYAYRKVKNPDIIIGVG